MPPSRTNIADALTGIPTAQVAGVPYTVKVRAVDSFFNTVTTVNTGSATIVTSDPNDTDPAASNFVNGVATFSVTSVTAAVG